MTTPENRMCRSGPLAGLRIVELEGLGPVPLAGMLLADMGADVIRVARPGSAPAGGAFPALDRGRQVVRADLKDPIQRDQILALIGSAEGLIEGFRPGVIEKLGLDPETLWSRNPGLVIGRMTGWGQNGPLSATAGHDINYIALTGALSAIGPRQQPSVPLNLVGDYGGGALYLAMGVLAAILRARETGQGDVIDAAMCDGALSLMTIFFDFASRGKFSDQRESNILDGSAPFYAVYECADGRFVSVGALEPHFYGNFCSLVADAELSSYPQYDRTRWPELRACLQRIFRSRAQEEWVAVFKDSDACVSPVLSLSEAADHPHIVARGSIQRIGGVAQPAPAPRFVRHPSVIRPATEMDLGALLERWTGS